MGVDGDIRDNIELLLEDRFNACLPINTKPDQAYLEQLQKTLTIATRAYGYYSPTFELKEVDEIDGCALLEATISLNQPILVDKVNIRIQGDGKQDIKFTEAVDKFKLKVGDILVDKHYKQLKKQLESLAAEYIYLDAKFIQSEIRVSQKAKTAEINLIFNTGTRYQLGKVSLVQQPQAFLQQEFVEALMPLVSDRYFTNSELYDARQELLETNYFATIAMQLQREKALDGKVPITITVTPQDRIDYSAGVGFSTDTDARLRFEYNNRRVTDHGYQFSSQLSLSDVIRELSGSLKLPSKDSPSESWYNIDAGYKEERTDELKSNTAKLGVSWSYAGAKHWSSVGFVDLVYDEFDTGVNDGNSLLVVPGVSWNYLKADNPVIPKHGYRIQAELQGAHESLLSDASFLQLSASYKGIYTVKPKHRLLFRLALGTTSTTDLTDLPLDYRFFAGGDNSVRGFDYRTISPQSDDGDFVGGKHLTVASLEYDYRFKDSWAVAIFTDSGSAYNDSPDFQYSAGVGLRWISPIGPIRFDVAVPIDNPENDFRIHISLGPDL